MSVSGPARSAQTVIQPASGSAGSVLTVTESASSGAPTRRGPGGGGRARGNSAARGRSPRPARPPPGASCRSSPTSGRTRGPGRRAPGRAALRPPGPARTRRCRRGWPRCSGCPALGSVSWCAPVPDRHGPAAARTQRSLYEDVSLLFAPGCRSRRTRPTRPTAVCRRGSLHAMHMSPWAHQRDQPPAGFPDTSRDRSPGCPTSRYAPEATASGTDRHVREDRCGS